MAIETLLETASREVAITPNLRQQLQDEINDMILHRFSELVQLLYRVDVSERKLKETLAGKEGDAAVLITDLLLERLQQKRETRQAFRAKDIPPDEAW